MSRCDLRPYCFFFNDTATTEIYTLSLHDALPILVNSAYVAAVEADGALAVIRAGIELVDESEGRSPLSQAAAVREKGEAVRSEEHTSELQSRQYLVCRLLLEKKKEDERDACYDSK